MNKTCCGGGKSRVCTRCLRWLCEWHFALSPAIVEGRIVVEVICSPSCGYHAGAPAMKKTE